MADEKRLWQRLAELARAGESEALRALFDELGDADRVYALSHLSAAERREVFSQLDPARAADALETLPESQAVETIGELAPAAAAVILEQLSSDDRADLLGQLERRDAEAILDAAIPETAADVRALLDYPTDSAGGLMHTEYVAVPDTATVAEVLTDLRANVERYSDYVAQYVYVVGTAGELRGVLPLRSVLLAHSGLRVDSLMIPHPISVPVRAPLDVLFEIFDRHAFIGVPVVTDGERLVGILLRRDIDRARVGRAEADQLKARGIVGGEELRSMPLLVRSGRRLSWLSINIVLNVLAASVIAFYQDTLQAAIALVVFLPIISDMSGCSGNQAVAVSLRELALGVTRPHETRRVWLKEVSVGVLNGAALGLLIAGVAWLWQGSVALGLVVGSALALNTVVAVSIGGTIPLLIKRLGFDPALASGPMLTTVTDMCGFFLVLSFATAFLSRLA